MVDLIASFVINFCIVFAAIVLFFAPFVAVFWYRHRTEIALKRPHFNYFMEKFFHSTESNALVATWAAAEAVIWFVIPEFLLILIMFMKVRRKVQLVIYDIIGTVVGTIIALALHLSESSLLSLPYVYQGMITHVNQWFSEYGIFGIFFQPFSGVPYKVFNAVALDYGFFIPFFIVLAVIARMIRYLIVYEITKALYPFVHRFVRKHYAILFIVAMAIFTMLLMKVSATYA
ncbi:MAG: DedA family protein [Candidatus Saccharibacteria bacterium GW2011_GWC2_48_9]|nr:MAG: DedA family protein [Candidatus Saccharibacteria bacterium GW2011_GWC2_48_9]